jgi:photosystem II stability/assembly factor-like uncharacterized protein
MILVSKDSGQTWRELADFHAMDKIHTTTGQPFVTERGIIFVPVWNAGFYTNGVTSFAIYRSEDRGSNWEKVYYDPLGTYAKHFFSNETGDTIYLGVGVNGGGLGGRIKYTPDESYLIKSEDYGRTWKKCLRVKYPTALYSGIVLDHETLLVTAREGKSVFRSVNEGKSWSRIPLSKPARCIAKIGDVTIISSDNAIFASHDDGLNWKMHNTFVKGLALRYPSQLGDKILMIGAGWRSLVLAAYKNVNEWLVIFDGTRVTGSRYMLRMSILKNSIFLGDEFEGKLLKVPIPRRTLNTSLYALLSRARRIGLY